MRPGPRCWRTCWGRQPGASPGWGPGSAAARWVSGLLDHARSLGIRAAFVAGDEVYGGRELRRGIRERGMGYVLAVRANHTVGTGS